MLKAGDTVSWDIPSPAHNFVAEELPLDILFEDEYFLLLNKPAGMLVHPVRNEQTGTIANAVLGYYRRIDYKGGFHPVHRIDRNTSGALLVAKTAEGQHLLSTCDNQKKLGREYLAIVRQEPNLLLGGECFMNRAKHNFIVDAPIARIDGVRHGIDFAHGKCACTHVEILCENADGYKLLRLTLDTGRTHQIRVHMAHIGMPLTGDALYGDDMGIALRQMLHSTKIIFTHPFSGEKICVAAPLPQDFTNVLRKTGLQEQ